MAATAITCPRCKGEGEIRVMDAANKWLVGTPCPVCRGTGSASWREPMGAPPKGASRGAT